MDLKLFLDCDSSRPPNDRERAALTTRMTRVENAGRTRRVAMGNLTKIATESGLTAVRVRKQFIRLETPIDSATTSDRTAPPHAQRPPATRLFSPNGIALPLMLIALFEAQARTAPGRRSAPTPLPLRADGSHTLGWTKLLATDVGPSGEGRSALSVSDKQLRQLKNALKRIEEEGLVQPKDPTRKTGRYEEFRLMNDGALFGRRNGFYRVPGDEDVYFDVPTALFTNGWVHVLEDSELALLLITMYKHRQRGGEEYKLAAGTRALHFGLGRDSFDAHFMLDRLGLIEVSSDPNRSDGGRVLNYGSRGAEPHSLKFLPAGLDRDGGVALLDVLAKQLNR